MVINATLSNSNSSWSVVQVDFTDRQVFELKLFLLLMLMLSHHPSEIIWDYFPWEWIWLIPKIIFVLPFFALLWNELSKICSVVVGILFCYFHTFFFILFELPCPYGLVSCGWFLVFCSNDLFLKVRFIFWSFLLNCSVC